jgi:cytochrome P450
MTALRLGRTTARANGARRAPGPRGAPVIGSALDLLRDTLGTHLRALHEHGDLVRFVTGPRAFSYAVFDPDGIQRVLAREADRYRKDNVFYEEVRWALGDGLLNSQDERWLRQKRSLQPIFTRRRIAGYVPAMVEEVARVAERWAPVAVRGGSVDLHEDMIELSLQVVSRALFGTDAGRAIPVVRAAFPVLGDHALRRAFAPVRLPRSWPLPANRRAGQARRSVYGVCDELIAARRAAPTGGEDLLSLLLVQGEEPLEDAEVRDQVLIFLLAGHDTTGLALTFALHLLGSHPEAQLRVREEVDAALGDRDPTAEDVDALPYTTMVLKEAMRLYPPAYGFGRRTPTGDRIGPYDIEPGADIHVFPWVTHRHPRLWEEPERFDPERFSPERSAGRHPYAYIPFGGGPRACIGRHFSMLEATVALAGLVRAYELATPDAAVPVTPRITLHPSGPVPCRLAPAR